MRPPGEHELFDSILDTPDSPPDGQQPSMEVITLDSSSPTSPGPNGQPVFSPMPMEVSQDHEDFSVEELLSPEAQKPRSPGMVRRHDLSEDELFIYKKNLEYFEAIKTSYQNQV